MRECVSASVWPWPEARRAGILTHSRTDALTHSRASPQMSEQTYDDGRARNLEEILRALAERIRELDAQGRLLANASELTKLLGEARSELFHYEVRATYDTPEVAESRRIVNDAIQQAEQRNTWQSSEGTEDGDDAPEW